MKIVMTALLVETNEHWKQIEEGFQKLGFGIPKLVGKFKTLAGKGGKGGRSDVVIEVENKYVPKMAIHPMHLSGGFSWCDDYYDNNRAIVPREARKFFVEKETIRDDNRN